MCVCVVVENWGNGTVMVCRYSLKIQLCAEYNYLIYIFCRWFSSKKVKGEYGKDVDKKANTPGYMSIIKRILFLTVWVSCINYFYNNVHIIFTWQQQQGYYILSMREGNITLRKDAFRPRAFSRSQILLHTCNFSLQFIIFPIGDVK